ncbi:MAG: glycoside hydrolase family 11 protein [Polyangia bacterium]
MFAALTLAACATGEVGGGEGGHEGGSGGSSPTGTGGTSTGGTGTGGFTATGGATGSGGFTATGGITGEGGVTATGGHGGIGGNGGRIGTGGQGTTGSGGRAGTTGSGGRSGSGGATGGSQGTGGGSTNACAMTSVPSGGTSHCSSNQSGSVGNQQWTIWSSGSGGCLITYGSSAAFSATWNNSGDFLARVGQALGSSKTYDQFTTIAADFAETKSGSGGGYSSIGIYGWSVSPLVEFYVDEDSYNHLGGSGTKMGTFTIDGEGTYDVYKHTQVNQPSIQGTSTFDQFISVRQSARTCGHISLSKHFAAWKGFGMTLGKLEEAKVLIEAGGGSGRIDFTTASVTAQ